MPCQSHCNWLALALDPTSFFFLHQAGVKYPSAWLSANNGIPGGWIPLGSPYSRLTIVPHIVGLLTTTGQMSPRHLILLLAASLF